jgi:hypothetical protein
MHHPSEVVLANRGCCLYLDAHYFALAVLEDYVDLYLVLRSVVEKVDPGIGLGRLAGQFHLHEAFEQRPELAPGPDQRPGDRASAPTLAATISSVLRAASSLIRARICAARSMPDSWVTSRATRSAT